MLLAAAPAFAQDDGDAAPPANAAAGPPSLDREQQAAVGVVVARPVAASPPARAAAFGRVLDPAALVADAGEVEATRAAVQAAAAEVDRLRGLQKAGAGASLKTLQAAQAGRARARADAESAAARFASQWGPLASMPAAERQPLIAAAAAGRRLLVRAEVPGRQMLSALPAKATLDVDGVAVPARVLGALPAAGGGAQSAGVLLDVGHPPAGLGAGARVAVALEAAAESGFAVPRGALLYDESGAYVFRELPAQAGDEHARYEQRKVELLQPLGDGWLVRGLDGDDRIVVQGAGVLWSLQGVRLVPADDDD